MQKIRVAHVIYNLQRGGAERLTLDICRALNKRETIESLLIVFDDQNDFPEISEGLTIIKCSSSVYLKFPWKVMSDLENWNHLMTQYKPDIIHSHLFYADWVSRENLYNDKAYFSHIHGMTTQYERMPYRKWLSREHAIRLITRKHIQKKYKACHNQFIANSQATLQYLFSTLQCHPNDAHLLPNAIDRLKFSRKKNDFSQRLIRLVSTGTLNENKNHAFLLLVVMQLLAKGRQVSLDILGDGPLFKPLEKQIRSYNLENIVHLHGMTQHVEYFLQNGDVYVHASVNESFGLALAEALSVGLPVVSLDAKGNRDIVEEGGNGFLVSSHDPEIFADKILAVVKDENTYIEFSNRAFESAGKYEITQYADNLERLYRNELKFRRQDRVEHFH